MSTENWREAYSQKSFDKKETFKLPTGSKEIMFDCDKPKEWTDVSVMPEKEFFIFDIIVDSTPYAWFVNKKTFAIMNGIVGMGEPLKGRRAVVTRTGEKRLTKWSIVPIEN